jgi:hypothetical protein
MHVFCSHLYTLSRRTLLLQSDRKRRKNELKKTVGTVPTNHTPSVQTSHYTSQFLSASKISNLLAMGWTHLRILFIFLAERYQMRREAHRHKHSHLEVYTTKQTISLRTRNWQISRTGERRLTSWAFRPTPQSSCIASHVTSRGDVITVGNGALQGNETGGRAWRNLVPQTCEEALGKTSAQFSESLQRRSLVLVNKIRHSRKQDRDPLCSFGDGDLEFPILLFTSCKGRTITSNKHVKA